MRRKPTSSGSWLTTCRRHGGTSWTPCELNIGQRKRPEAECQPARRANVLLEDGRTPCDNGIAQECFVASQGLACMPTSFVQFAQWHQLGRKLVRRRHSVHAEVHDNRCSAASMGQPTSSAANFSVSHSSAAPVPVGVSCVKKHFHPPASLSTILVVHSSALIGWPWNSPEFRPRVRITAIDPYRSMPRTS